MLREFIEDSRLIPESKRFSAQEYAQRSIRTFFTLVDFLRIPQRFPNKDINLIATLMWELMRSMEVPIAFDQWGIPSLLFTAVADANSVNPLLILPRNFLSQVREDVVMQLGVTAYMASQCRDYYAGNITGGNSGEVNLRARAFEAETLLTLQRMASQEGVRLNWNPIQQSILQESPQGLASLPAHLNYPIPAYMTLLQRN